MLIVRFPNRGSESSIFFNPLDQIPKYDQVLRIERISKLKTLILQQIKTINLPLYLECFVNLPERYFKSVEDLIHVLEKRDCRIIRVDKDNTKKRNEMMVGWSSQEITSNNKDH